MSLVGVPNKTVLVVENDKNFCDFLEIILQKMGCKAVVFATATEAVCHLESSGDSIQAIITDWKDAGEKMMSVSDGIPVLVLTGYVMDSPPGCFDLMTKPVGYRELQLKIDAMLNEALVN